MSLRSYIDKASGDRNLGKIALGTVVGALAVRYLAKKIPAYLNRRKNSAKIAQRLEKLAKKIADSKKLIPKLEISEEKRRLILEADVTTLLQLLDQKVTTSEEILVIYYQQAIAMHEKFNFLTDVNFEEALKIARQCDQLRHTDPKVKEKAFFGIPISVKDCIFQKGFDNTCGIINRIDIIHEKDAVGLARLIEQGAIPFVRTNVPQAMLSYACENAIFGESKNPWNPSRTPGGSSGGESAIVASLGSPLGVGTDIGGSVRIPAAFCGIVGFKPTVGRISNQGFGTAVPSSMGQLYVRSTIGPIAKTVDDMNLFMKCAATSHLVDPYCAKIPWENNLTYLTQTKLRIGYYKTLNLAHASAASQRAVQEVVERLKSLGHELIEIEMPDTNEINNCNLQILFGEGKCRSLRTAVQGEDLHPSYNVLLIIQGFSSFTRSLLKKLLIRLGEKNAAATLMNVRETTTHEYLLNVKRQKRLQDQFMEIWAKNKLDCILGPSFSVPAIKSANMSKLGQLAIYTALYNFMNMPAGVVPITTVKEGEDNYEYKVSDKQQGLEREIKKDIKGSVGLPIGVQVATLPFEDEKCISVMRVIEKEFPFRRENPIVLK